MRRRAFIAGLTAATSLTIAARAQQAKVPVVGFVRHGTARSAAPLAAAFRAGLKDAGFIEGQNIAIEYRFTEDRRERLPELVSDLVRREVAVIVANSAAAFAAKAATSTVPIVFLTGSDPVETGLVASLNRPEGNLTGIVFTVGDLVAKRFGLLRDLVPNASVLGVLLDPKVPAAAQMFRGVEEARRVLGIQIEMVEAASEQELEAAFATMVRVRAGGVVVGGGPLYFSQDQRIVELAARHALAASYATRNYTEAGGLMSYGPNQQDTYRYAGIYAARVLRGTKPADLPVEQATKFELVINLKTAKTLRLSVPTSMQLLADEVIE